MTQPSDPYFIDFAARVRALQAAMAEAGIDVYLGSRLRTLSWLTDAFFPWRSFVVVPPDGVPTAITFVIDAARAASMTKVMAVGRPSGGTTTNERHGKKASVSHDRVRRREPR